MINPLVITQTGSGSNRISINTQNNVQPYPQQPVFYPVPYPCYYYPYMLNYNDNNNNLPKSNNSTIEKCFHSEPMNLTDLNNVSTSICKIMVSYNGEGWSGTGFFMEVRRGKKNYFFLISNEHVIKYNIAVDKLDIKIKTKKGNIYAIKLDGRMRAVICLTAPIDITAVEILPSDKLFGEIDFLSYDVNCEKGQYSQYINKNIYILQHPDGKPTTHVSGGKILNISDGYEIAHNADTDYGSSGSPIILISNNRVIGVHKKWDKSDNRGTLIGKILEKIDGTRGCQIVRYFDK